MKKKILNFFGSSFTIYTNKETKENSFQQFGNDDLHESDGVYTGQKVSSKRGLKMFRANCHSMIDNGRYLKLAALSL
jgi:hypothetical protein